MPAEFFAELVQYVLKRILLVSQGRLMCASYIAVKDLTGGKKVKLVMNIPK